MSKIKQYDVTTETLEAYKRWKEWKEEKKDLNYMECYILSRLLDVPFSDSVSKNITTLYGNGCFTTTLSCPMEVIKEIMAFRDALKNRDDEPYYEYLITEVK